MLFRVYDTRLPELSPGQREAPAAAFAAAPDFGPSPQHLVLHAAVPAVAGFRDRREALAAAFVAAPDLVVIVAGVPAIAGASGGGPSSFSIMSASSVIFGSYQGREPISIRHFNGTISAPRSQDVFQISERSPDR